MSAVNRELQIQITSLVALASVKSFEVIPKRSFLVPEMSPQAGLAAGQPGFGAFARPRGTQERRRTCKQHEY